MFGNSARSPITLRVNQGGGMDSQQQFDRAYNRPTKRRLTRRALANSRRLGFEHLEDRLQLSGTAAVESFPTLLGQRTAQGGAALGTSVAMDGDWAVAGAVADDESGTLSG